MGAKVSQNESSRERKFPRTFVPSSESSRARIASVRKGQGVKGPRSEWARILLADSLHGANGPRSEKAQYRVRIGD